MIKVEPKGDYLKHFNLHIEKNPNEELVEKMNIKASIITELLKRKDCPMDILLSEAEKIYQYIIK